MRLPLWVKLAIAALTWGGLLTRVEAQTVYTNDVTDSRFLAAAAPYWAQRDSLEHLCAVGRVDQGEIVVDTLRPVADRNDRCARPGDVGLLAFIETTNPAGLPAILEHLLIHRPNFDIVFVMSGPGKVLYAIRVAH